MKPHLLLAHRLWEELLSPQDIVIDATCGNGHDTLVLAKLAKHVYSLDIQAEALKSAKTRTSAFNDKITFIHGCHSQLPIQENVKLIVYNLGYLPGGDKNKTTMWETTLASIQQALKVVADDGMICVTCYPGHSEGKREQDSLLDCVKHLGREFLCCHHEWLNRPSSPSLLTIRKISHS